MSLTSGMLAGLPLQLVIRPMTVHIESGSSTVQIVSVIYAGSQDQLRGIALESFQNNRNFLDQIKQIEVSAAKIVHAPETMEEQENIQNEFYPEEVVAGVTESAKQIDTGETAGPESNFSKDAVILADPITAAPASGQPPQPLSICGRTVCDKFEGKSLTLCAGDISTCEAVEKITVREALAIAYKTRKPEIDKIIADLDLIAVTGTSDPGKWNDAEQDDIWENLHEQKGKTG